MNAAFAPFGSVDPSGKIAGFDVDIMQVAVDEAGLKINGGLKAVRANSSYDKISPVTPPTSRAAVFRQGEGGLIRLPARLAGLYR
ncbi:MAG: hypothetical protein ABI171_03250 [Collimonas sp.]|uniref:hypothetical protein n=1 Tax=Collimonas sp. TaxID=1963772 RepID=UPI003267E6CD